MSVVSVIIPCFNREGLLGATLDSLRAQTFPQWEAVLVDDHSADGSMALARRYEIEDSRIRAVSRTGDLRGANVCRNQGLRAARGEYIVFLDSDDLLSPACLEKRIEGMKQRPDCGFGVYQTELFKSEAGDQRVLWNAFTEVDDLKRFLNLDTVWITTAPIWKKSAVESLGGFEENTLSFQDWAIHVQALVSGMKYYKDPKRDNFHRHEYDKSATISAKSTNHPDHLRSHERLFVRTWEDLRRSGKLDAEDRLLMAGCFWWLAGCWNRKAETAAARNTWRKALEFGLCNRFHYVTGCFIFRVSRIRGGGRLRRMIQSFWPWQYHRFNTDHLWNTRVDATAEQSDPVPGCGGALKPAAGCA